MHYKKEWYNRNIKEKIWNGIFAYLYICFVFWVHVFCASLWSSINIIIINSIRSISCIPFRWTGWCDNCVDYETQVHIHYINETNCPLHARLTSTLYVNSVNIMIMVTLLLCNVKILHKLYNQMAISRARRLKYFNRFEVHCAVCLMEL